MKILLIGSGAREHIIAKRLKDNSETKLFVFASTNNPGILELAEDLYVGDSKNNKEILEYTAKIKPDIAWIGPEAPLAQGIVDLLVSLDIECVGPFKDLAQIETSKAFTRNLLVENNIPAYPKFKVFNSEEGLEEFINTLSAFVIKPDGLTGGKGVQVQGDHFQDFAESLPYMQELIVKRESFVIEEKLIGQEFSLMSFCDGLHAQHMPAVQDHKRAYEDDQGPNTGGMGSYSCANHSLPFLKDEDIAEAKKINEQTLVALAGYKGILYGGFIATQNGVKLIEYNARFGDPEVMNYLTILKTDLTDISEAITKGELDQIKVEFENKATVCKYVVPEGYPGKAVKDKLIDISEVDQNQVDLYYGSLDKTEGGLYLKGSRTLGVVAQADTLVEAEKIVQTEIEKIKGPVFFRKDIGTEELIDKRVMMMENLRKN
jgi:fusion protein PurCD